MLVKRVEQTQINKNNKIYPVIEDFCKRSKLFYNYTNNIILKEFIDNGNWIRYHQLQRDLKTTEPYKSLMSQSSQCVLQVLDRNWKSYFVAMKRWKHDNSRFLGEPKLPNCNTSGDKFTWFLKNNQTYIKDGRLYFKLKCMNGYSFKTKVKGRLIAVRFVPKYDIFTLEIVYECEMEEQLANNDRIASIDLGVNNFATITNNIGKNPVIINGRGIKSVNQYYNKEISKLRNKRNDKRINKLELKRYNIIKNYIHNSSNYVMKYCNENNIDNLVVGYNGKWKQVSKMGKTTNQIFQYIPYSMFLEQLEYKAQEFGIKVFQTEESYTSGTSFLDDELPIKENYNKSRRIHRGLFVSNNGIEINADVNASLQIMKKVFPNAFVNGIEGSLNPVIVNMCDV